MHSKLLHSVAAAVSAAVLNLAAVTVVYAQAKAALTRDVDRPTAQPVNGKCSPVSVAYFSTASCRLYTVPAGKRLVVEFVGYMLNGQSNDAVASLSFGLDPGLPFPSNGSPNRFFVSPVLTYEVGTVRTFTGTQALTIYLDEGQAMLAAESRSGRVVVDFGGDYLSFSGYLVDK